MGPSLVLIADDDPAVRRVVSRCLRAEGLSTLEAADGRAALEVARAIAVDLVILDLGMPGMNGQALCAALRERAETSGVPIFVLTGHASASSEEALLDLGADEFMGKPFRCDELLARVRAVFRRAGVAR